ncbi:MAG: glycosyltransferase [Flavobacteriales bacterium]|nr:glycosyltransferase [Flavobacteriales bacterium]
MQVLIWIILITYGFFLLFIFVYSLVQLSLSASYLRSKRQQRITLKEPENWPLVTIQLPIYNERYVVERLIRAVAEIDYPKDKIEVQVLDDSTDDTSDIISKAILHYSQDGISIKHIKRENRIGFKAGALKKATESAIGEFIAIFDADFIPEPNFLKKSIPLFTSHNIGMVQTKWEHLNPKYNLLTRLQAFGLDAHFTVEQSGRNYSGHFINFNGTAGIWRKTCIIDAGNWQSDTLTEDLDLSYRAQLKGWKFVFDRQNGTPAELPAAINALKTQQYRWNKGAAECAVKNLNQVLQSGLPMSTKIHSFFHLLNSFVFVCILFTGIMSVPLLWIKQTHPQYNFIFKIGALLSISFLFIGYFYWLATSDNIPNKKNALWKFLLSFPLFLSIYMGLSFHNSLAVLEGYFGYRTPFIRTPKFNITENTQSLRGNIYRATKMSRSLIPEILLFLYFIYAVYLGFALNDYGLFLFHFMLIFGFGSIVFFSIRHSRA